MLQKNDNRSLDRTTFLKFRRLYLMAFLLIAVTIVIAQVLIQIHLNSQLSDSRIVNIAGRQRMLSQKLVKGALILDAYKTKEDSDKILGAFRDDLNTFIKIHEDLQYDLNGLGKMNLKNTGILSLFADIEQNHKELVNSATNIIGIYHRTDDRVRVNIKSELINMKEVEGEFLLKMDAIVNEYDAISQQKVKDLKQKEYLLLAISLSILLLEILFIFRPISIYIKNVIRDLIFTEQKLKDKVEKVNDLYVTKENSLQELQGLNYAINNAALFANLKEDGSIIYISKKFRKLIGAEMELEGMVIDDLIQNTKSETASIRELIENHRHSIWTGEINVATQAGKRLWLEISVVPMNQVKKNKSVLILCTDITKRIKSQKELVWLSEQKIRKKVDLQKIQASQIVEAQEEERKRIAKDIHDGIGQMLTALKFNVESINFNENEAIETKVAKLKTLLVDLIKEVRAVTFNLTPPELRDYGIVPTLSKLSDQLSKLTGKKIYFENKTGFNGRFDSLVETNLYRVVQEAVNNSLKYANANYILITVSHSSDKLSIVIDDDGKGFDVKHMENKEKDSGLGLFFMRERISYINGRIFINSEKEKGTRITINMNLSEADSLI